jgi:hypothetical protein
MKPAERLMAERVDGLSELEGRCIAMVRAGARTAARLVAECFAVYVETPRERADIFPENADALERNMALASALGATVVRVSAGRASDGLNRVRPARRDHAHRGSARAAGRSGSACGTARRSIACCRRLRWAATQVVPLDAGRRIHHRDRWNGTLVTTVLGRNSSAPLISSARWL